MRASNRFGRLVSLFTVVALLIASLPGAGVVLADPPHPKPEIVDFSVSCVAASFTYTATGSVTNCDDVSNVMVEVFGQPFDVYYYTDANGDFDISVHAEYSYSGLQVIARATCGDGEVSDDVSVTLP